MDDREQPGLECEGHNADTMEQIGAHERRLVREKLRGQHSAWYGLGMMGMIGWSVVLPALIGMALGAWLDVRFPGGPPWTLIMLVIGLAMGTGGAWSWIAREQAAIEDERATTAQHECTADRED